MKKLLPLLLLPSLVFANPINDMVNRTFERMKAVSGVQAELHIWEGPWNSTESFPWANTVKLPKGMLRLIQRDPNALAAVLGHELYHIKSGCRDSPQCELACDKAGVKWANEAGFDGKAMVKFMRIAKQQVGNPPPGAPYPTWEERIRNIEGE